MKFTDLFAQGINYNELPAWQKRGVGLYWEEYAKPGLNPFSELPVESIRRRLATNQELPLGDAYTNFIRSLLPAIH